MGKILIITGIILVILGTLLQFSDKFPFPGKLPGDIVVDRGNFKLYIPVTTSIVISVVITILLLLINKARQ